MRLVLLWFGSWKNSMSCYAPAWVKTDTKRFPRSRDSAGGAEFGSCAKIQPSVASESIRYLTIHICTDPLNRVYSSKMAAAKGALIRQSQAGAKAVT